MASVSALQEFLLSTQRVGDVEKNLLARSRAGDREACSTLFRQHVQQVFRTCCALVGDAEAEDVMQKVFIQAFKNIRKFEGRSRFSTWLHGIAMRIAANHRRGQKRRQRLATSIVNEEPDRVSTDVEAHANARISLGRLEESLDRLKDNQRTAFLLHHARGLTLTEVAEAMGASVQTTSARIKAARRQLMAHFAEKKSAP